MSKIGKNIRKIRVVKKLSQASFAQIFNLARPSVGAYEEGRAEPKIETVLLIAQYFGLSVDTLLTRELTINDLYRFDSLKRKNSSPPDERIQPRTPPVVMNTAVVLINRHMDYIEGFENYDFIDSLPRFHFPGINTLEARAFEVDGDSMSFENKGIIEGDLAICGNTVEDGSVLNAGALYGLVTKNQINIRRLKSSGKKPVFLCDNPDWPSEEYNLKDLLEIRPMYAVYSRSLNPPIHLKDRIEELEDRYLKLAAKLDKLMPDHPE